MLFPRTLNFTLVVLLACLPKFAQADADIKNPAPETQIMLCTVAEFDDIATDIPEILDDKIRISSLHASIKQDQIAQFTGSVILVDKSQRILADQLAFNRLKMQIEAIGNIHYQGKQINIFADTLSASKIDNATTMTSASYQLHGNPGHGTAASLSIDGDGVLSLIDSTFTTCLQEVPDWQIKAAEINLSASGDFGEAYHAQFRILDVPIFYVPYFSFPISKKRLTGFLYPQIETTTNTGLEVTVPFYLNITENFDATITPRYMSKRGLQLQTEFRYMMAMQSGQIDLEYLDNDQAIKSNNDPRYLARFQHVGTFSENFRAYVDYTTISDDNYLVDIGSKQYNSNDAYLYQTGELAYFGKQWQAKLQLQDFEVLGEHQPSYKTLPHFELSAQQPLNFVSGQFELYSEITNFQSSEKDQVEAKRYHIEAGFILPIVRPAWFLNSEVKLMHTYYQQDNIAQGSNLDETVTRTLPKLRIHGGINFDRELVAFGQNYRHTLEPQLQYLYVPEKDQSNIGLYDTTLLQDDFHGIFRDTSYSGLDRIAAANQYTWGITSRLLDDENLEIVRVSIGRIQYFGDNNTGLANDPLLTDNDTINDKQSSVAADLFYRINHQWQVSGDIQYNTLEDFTNKGQVKVDYQLDKYNLVQLNHRYTRNVSGDSLEQVSLLTSFAINKNWAFVGRLTQDLQQNRSLESYAGFQYESCCWAVRIAYHRHINSNLDPASFAADGREEFDTGISIKFIIKGLDGKQSAIGTQEMFNKSIFGYKRPYYLQN
ncbi:LPS biosynthesis protein [Colwellia sp. MT41]|uniref:LPS-assembly protein LptD n=1 Tax=Colwellia marinimaniae TaxID=1513592 RepID=A0ABQ0MQK3_9GAMM|nr:MULTISPECIES: LPS assembly protein LptD [Colwellia]ALO36024.1 LPS biosynthesis protein [Colwellia sp. MT41]GAW94462.1 LPS-assembly protein LptD [Colwellia marinimaniae]